MDIFDQIEFITTEDSSTGLYSKHIQDIFHSKSGAFKESYEKFFLPARNLIPECMKSINILDICYGIGYNSKTFLNNTKDYFIHIDALENNKEFIYLSPLVKDNIVNDVLKKQIILQIIKDNDDINEYGKILNKIKMLKLIHFFEPNIINFLQNEVIGSYKNIPVDKLNQFLHNIYYNYISDNNNYAFNRNSHKDFEINYYLGDARKTILQVKNQYDIVFLDAFSSQKDPTLWTVDFLYLIKSKMKKNSMLISYSKSTPFRSALIELGFYVGKTYIDSIDMGTVASLNKKFILNPLNEFDLQLFQTRAGITYKDPSLSFDSSTILLNRKIESESSSRISHTQFLKFNSY